jgi:hypothetical protein
MSGGWSPIRIRQIIEDDLELLAPFDSYAVSCPLQFFAADAYDV